MRLARRVARSRGECLSFRYSCVEWESPNRPKILLPSNRPYYLWSLVDSTLNPLARIVGKNGHTDQVIDLRNPALYRTYSGREMWLSDVIEEADTCSGYFHQGAPKSGEIALDVGAYCGEVTVEMAIRVGPGGQVYALEPDPQNRALLQKNIDLHRLNNVTILPYGLWNKTATVKFAATGGSGSSLKNVPGNSSFGSKTLQITTLSPGDLFDRIGQLPDFIKMDIEGAEVEVVNALAPLLTQASKRIRMAIASYHILDGQPTHEIITPMLLSAGFSAETGYPEHTTTWAEIG